MPAPIKNDVQALHDFTNDLNFLDATQRLKVQPDGTVVFNFGKYVGQPVLTVLRQEKNYGFWILEKEFSSQVKQIIRQMMKQI
jgi:DNA polymerase-3 subunit epsilon